MTGGVFNLEEGNADVTADTDGIPDRTPAWPLPKVVRDAGVELVARFQQLTTAALFLQTVLDFPQSRVARADLLRRQFTCQQPQTC